MEKRSILAIDPGSHKVGYAVVYDDLSHGKMGIVAPDVLATIFKEFFINEEEPVMAIGDGTKSDNICNIFLENFPKGKIVKVNEKNTTFNARKKYFQENPPKWFWKFIPLSLQYPQRPIDDYAAWMIGEKYFNEYTNS